MPASYLSDGFATLITLTTPASVHFKEKAVTPLGAEGGGENDQTTFRNTALRTALPKKLKKYKPITLTVSYSPEILDDIDSAMNLNQSITLTFSDGSSVVFWGWLDDFSPAEVVEGEQPEAEITIIPSMLNDSNVETTAVLTTAA